MTTNNGSLKKVQGRYNGPQLEQEILTYWENNRIFEKSLELSKGRPRFSFNEGPPTANGQPGIHHVLARTFKDIYPRYKTMRGYYAPRKGGWDTHGLPVEHEIEKQLGIFDKQEIEEKVGILEFTRLCRNSVMTYIGDWEKMTRRMGYWVNLDQAYYTLDNHYIESVWNLLRRIWDKGLIYKGYKVVPYDPRIGATLSSHEVSLGYQDVEDPSITVRFRVADTPNLCFLVWTTTPWTLPSNLLLAVGKDIEYSYVEVDNETLILARARVEAYFADQPHKIVKTVTGSELLGMRYHRLLDWLNIESGDPFRVCEGDFVNTLDGTGVVHIAPAYGVDDLELGQQEGLPVLHGVGLDGNFKPEAVPVSGTFFKEADPIICEILEQQGSMYKNEKAIHSYPFGWRTGDPLIYYAKEAWFIRTTEIKDRLVNLNKTIHWVPETIRDGRFGNWLENNIDWALSRERFWGTPLPIWTNGEGDYICIGSLAELEKLSGQPIRDLDLHRPHIDDIRFFLDGHRYHRVPEVIDCWFDSGAMSYAQWHYPFENREKFEEHFPADYICEAIDQTRGWFYTLHAISTLVDDSIAYRNCVCLSHIVDKNGKKMSKSLGNIVNPYEVFDSVGVDSLRWLFLSRTAPDAQKRISVDIVREVASTFVNTLWNAYAFFILYAKLDDLDLSKQVPIEQRPEIDQWILALTQQTIKITTDSLENYDAYTAGKAIEELVDKLSNWYIRRNRRRFWRSENGENKQAAYLTLFECLDSIQRLIAPFMPFLAESMYLNLSRCLDEAAESIHLTEWPNHNEKWLNKPLIFEMDVVQTVVGLGRTARESSRIRVRQPLQRILIHCVDPMARQAIVKHKEQLQDELNIRQIDFIDSSAEIVRYEVTPNFRILGKRFGKLMPAIKDALSQANPSEIIETITQGSYSMEVDGQPVEFEKEDLQITTKSAEGFACSEADGYLVALDTQIDHELLVEGIARELVRTVQEARKTAGLEISDRILLSVSGSALIGEAMTAHRDHIMSETLVTGACDKNQAEFEFEHSLDEHTWNICFKKA
ncbi:MAG: isoleucine--tRNA ligase [Gammaproteobacteria bacterium]|nr:isoleucine--tRNA ligase [Gammaproteobacteria bacterium]MCY4219394.1 isoleucine--tRNA ligase [Gammaproteobacteria bacterium]